jgi:hypothetical protein
MTSEKQSQPPFLIWALLIFASSMVLALLLLYLEKFSGAEFIAFVVAYGVLSMAIGFAPQVQEISVAGNVLKLREVKAEAEEVIKSLLQARSDMLGSVLKMAMKQAGGFHDGQAVDPRVAPYLECVEMFERYNCYERYKEDLRTAANVLLKQQALRALDKSHTGRKHLSDEIVKPSHLTALVVRNSPLDPMGKDGQMTVLSQETEAALEAYVVLYQLHCRLSG